jgi:8-oxoguanine deaminase
MNYLIKNARAIAAATACPNADSLRISGGRITEIAVGLSPIENELCIDARDCVIYPGLINSHHHLAQSVLKGVPAGLDVELGQWLAAVPFRFWPHIDPALMYDAALIGLSELLRSGATTCCDHHYLYHAASTPELEDALWAAADTLGIRLLLCRGGATTLGSHKGLANTGIVPESIEQMLRRLERTRQRYHQPGPNAMRRLVVAPTSLMHSSTADDLRQLARFARDHDLKMHSHLLEVDFDQQQAVEKYGMTAVEYAESVDWLGPDIWFAHLVQATAADIQKLAATGTGISHCPTSNLRLGSGIAPVLAMQRAGMSITVGLDGSASSECGSMIQELNLAWLLQRGVHGAAATTLEQCLEWGSANAAELLGLDDIGSIEVGKAADLVLYDISGFRYQGLHSIEQAPLLCGEPVVVKHSFVNGRQVIVDGDIVGLDIERLRHSVQAGISRLLKKTGQVG